MKAILLLRNRFAVSDNAFVEIAVWEVPNPVRGSNHRYKYRLALVVDERCLMRYDNEAGKGDHKHISEREVDYAFAGIERL